MSNGAPLHPDEAKRLIRQVLRHGDLRWTRHAMRELEKDELDLPDAVNVLRGGVVEPAEWEGGQWRYRVRTTRMIVVITFVDDGLRVITAWRLGP